MDGTGIQNAGGTLHACSTLLATYYCCLIYLAQEPQLEQKAMLSKHLAETAVAASDQRVSSDSHMAMGGISGIPCSHQVRIPVVRRQR